MLQVLPKLLGHTQGCWFAVSSGLLLALGENTFGLWRLPRAVACRVLGACFMLQVLCGLLGIPRAAGLRSVMVLCLGRPSWMLATLPACGA